MPKLTLGDLVYRLGFENEEQFIARLRDVLRQAEGTAEQGGKRAGTSFVTGWKSVFSGAALGSFLGSVLGQAFMEAQAATRRFISESISDFRAYEQGLVQLRIAGVSNLGEVEAQIKAIAEQSRVFSVREISTALGELVKAGFAAGDALNIVKSASYTAGSEVDVLTGQFADLGTTATQVGAILRSFGLSTDEAGRATDVLARAAQDSSANITDLVAAIARVAPVARQAGLSLEDTAAALAVLTNKGWPAEVASRGLRSAIQALVDPPALVKKKFEELGLSIVDAQGNIRPFLDVVRRLADVTAKGGEGAVLLAQGMDNLSSSVAASLGQSADEVRNFTQRLYDAKGAAKTLAENAQDSVAGSLAEMQARLKDARVELGQSFAPALVWAYDHALIPFAKGLSNLVDWIDALWRRLTGLGEFPLSEELTKVNEQIADVTARLSKARRALEEWQKIAAQNPGDKKLQQDLADLRKGIEQTEQMLQDLLRRRMILVRALRGESLGGKPPKPKPIKPSQPPAEGGGETGGAGATGGQEPDFAQRAAEYIRVLQAQAQLGLITVQEQIRELDRLYSQLAKSQLLAMSAGDEAQANRLLLVMASARREADRLRKEVGKLKEEAERTQAELWGPEGEFAGLDRAERWFTRSPATGPRPDERLTSGMATIGDAFAALQERMDTLRRQYELGQISVTDYLASLRELERNYSELLGVLDTGSEAWSTAADQLLRVRGEIDKTTDAIKRQREEAEKAQAELWGPQGEFAGLGAAMRWFARFRATGPAPDERLTSGMATAADAVQMLGEELGRLNAEFEAGVRPEASYKSELREILNASEALLQTLPKTSAEYVRLLQLIAQVKGALKGTTPGTGTATGIDVAQQTISALRQSFESRSQAVEYYLRRGGLTPEILQLINKAFPEFKRATADLRQTVNAWTSGVRNAERIVGAFSAKTVGQGISEFSSGVGGIVDMFAPGVGTAISLVGELIGYAWDGITQMLDDGSAAVTDRFRSAAKNWTLIGASVFEQARQTYQEKYLFGLITVTKQKVNETMFEVIQSVAGALEGGVVGALRRAGRAFLEGSQKWSQYLKEGVRTAIIDAVLEAMIKKSIFEGLLGDLLEKLSKDLAAGDYAAANADIAAIAAKMPDVIKFAQQWLGQFKSGLGTFGVGSGGAPTGANVITYQLPTAPVLSAPNWVREMGDHVARFGQAVDRLINPGITVRVDTGELAYAIRGASA